MKRMFVIGAALMLFVAAQSSAQLPGGSFGISASYAGESSRASFLYAVTPQIDLHFGLGFSSTSVNNPDPMPDPDSQSAMSIHAGLRYFLRGGDVAPYLGGLVEYSSPEEDHTIIGIQGVFGAQAMVRKKLGLFAHVGIGFGSATTKYTVGSDSGDRTITTIGLFTAAVGAAFYL